MILSFQSLLARLKEQYRNNKVPVVGAILAVTFLVLGIGGWAVYALWYQNPEKIVTDALVNAMTAKTTTFKVTSSSYTDGETSSMTLEGKAGHKEGASGSLRIESKTQSSDSMKVAVDFVHSVAGDDYIRLDSTEALRQQIIEYMSEGSDSSSRSMVQLLDMFLTPILERIDNKWVRFGDEEIKYLDAEVGEGYGCLEKSYEILGTNIDMMLELAFRYNDNKPFTVQERIGTTNGKVGYTVGIDKAATKRLIESLKTTKFFQTVEGCYAQTGDLLDDLTNAINDMPKKVRIELWIDQWTHELARIHIDVSDGKSPQPNTATYDIVTSFNAPISIDIPKTSMSFQDAIPEMSQLFGGDASPAAAAFFGGAI